MARINSKVFEWKAGKGKVGDTQELYYAKEENLDTLNFIRLANKSWGRQWYDLVVAQSYENAKAVLIVASKGKGTCLPIALNIIDDIKFIEAKEKGGVR